MLTYSGSPATRKTARPSVNSCPTGEQNKPTRINLTQLGPTWKSCLHFEIKQLRRLKSMLTSLG